MGMHAASDCSRGVVMVTSMAQLHMQAMTSVMSLQRRRWGWLSTSMSAVLPCDLAVSSLDMLKRAGVSPARL